MSGKRPNFNINAFLQEVRGRMLSSGLMPPENLIADKQAHRCPVSGKEREQDGVYGVFLDHPPSAWWRNFCTGGKLETYCAISESEMTPEERNTLAQRVKEERSQREKDQKQRWQEAAQTAKTRWDAASPAQIDHPYLIEKQVSAYGLREDKKGALLVPLYSCADNTLVSLQIIPVEHGERGKFEKRFMSGGQTKGAFFPISANDDGRDSPLLIAEGYATGASLHMATGYAVFVAFSCYNLEAVARMARELYPEREIILCADNDCETKKQDGTPYNSGVEDAKKAAQAIGGKLAICPAHEGRATDFNDLHCWRSLEAVRVEIEKALQKENSQQKSKLANTLNVIDIANLLSLDIPPRGHVLYPVIPEQGLAMLYAERGTGKTFAALHIAYAVASGGSVFNWHADRPRRTLFLDGEMPLSAMQERLISLVSVAEIEANPDYFHIVTPDLQEDSIMPNLATLEGQERIEPYLSDVEFVVVDNLATLARTGRSNDEDSWLPVQEFLLRLRRRGIAVLLIHHSNKSGTQRGTGAKEDILDTVIHLTRPSDYETEQGARFEVHLTKARGLFGKEAESFEAMLDNGKWIVRSVENTLVDRIKSLADDLTIRQIAEEVGKSTTTIHRICKNYGIKTKGCK